MNSVIDIIREVAPSVNVDASLFVRAVIVLTRGS